MRSDVVVGPQVNARLIDCRSCSRNSGLMWASKRCLVRLAVAQPKVGIVSRLPGIVSGRGPGPIPSEAPALPRRCRQRRRTRRDAVRHGQALSGSRVPGSFASSGRGRQGDPAGAVLLIEVTGRRRYLPRAARSCVRAGPPSALSQPRGTVAGPAACRRILSASSGSPGTCLS